jgi:hypothetical protein
MFSLNSARLGLHLSAALIAVTALSLTACNNNDDDNAAAPAPAAPSNVTLTGTAATGKAFSGKIEAVNKAGVKSTAVTVNADGTYSVVVPAGAPYLLHAIDPSGDPTKDLYSYAAAVGKTNVTSLTTQALLDANDNKPLAALVSAWATATLNDAKVLASAKKVTANLSDILAAKGLTNVPKINPFTYSFVAGSHTGYDAVLDQVKISYNCSASVCSYDVKNGESSFSWKATIDTSGITFDLKDINNGGNPVPTGNFTLDIVTTVSGFAAPKVTINNIPKPANKAEFCSASATTDAYKNLSNFSILSCDFNGTSGRITAQVTSPITVTYTIDYTYH